MNKINYKKLRQALRINRERDEWDIIKFWAGSCEVAGKILPHFQQDI